MFTSQIWAASRAQPAPDTNDACTGRGADGNLFRTKPLAPVQNGHALGQVAARATDVQARCRAAGQVNEIPVAQDILLHHDGVGPARDRRAREDAGRHGPCHRCRRLLPGRDARNDRQHPRTGPRKGRCLDRIAIHRGIVESGCHRPRPDRLGKNAAKGAAHLNRLGSTDRRYMRRNPGKGLVDADQRMAQILTVTAAAR